MTFFSASFQTVLLRYFLMMAVIVAAFAIGYPILAVISFPLFIAAFNPKILKPIRKYLAKTQKRSTW